jgi:hypothetical protein
LLPICCYCKKIRDDQNYWEQVEAYLTRHSDVQFSHAICPQCWEKEVRPYLARAPGGTSGPGGDAEAPAGSNEPFLSPHQEASD